MVWSGPTSDAQANWAGIVILNFAEFTLHTLAIAAAEMLMGLAKTGLGLCAVDRNDDSAAGAACAGLGRCYNL
jgi:hypothetical protein